MHDILEAARRAGRELVAEGRMSSDTLCVVGGPLLSLDEYVANLNVTAGRLLARAAEK